jgi:uncharacterized protein (DUF2147 family)
MTRTIIGTAAAGAVFILLASAAYAATAASITGRWITKDRDAVVEITPCGANVCGRIAKFLVAPPKGVDQRDVNNSDPKLRTRKIMGMMILQNLKEAGKEWKGTIYDPRSGKSYRSVVFLTKNGTLTVKGCFGPICQSQSWAKSNQ